MVRLFTRRRARDKGARHASSGLPAASAGAQAIRLGGPASAGEGARNLVALKARGSCMTSAAPPPPPVGAGRGGGSREPRRLSAAPPHPCRVGQRDPLLSPPPQGGEETRRDDPRTNSRAKGARRGHRST